MARISFENKELAVSFTLPESLTVRQQMQYRNRLLESFEEDGYTRHWIAVEPFIEDWKCEDIPDPAAFDLDAPASWKIGNIVTFVANSAAGWLMELEAVPKN